MFHKILKHSSQFRDTPFFYFYKSCSDFICLYLPFLNIDFKYVPNSFTIFSIDFQVLGTQAYKSTTTAVAKIRNSCMKSWRQPLANYWNCSETAVGKRQQIPVLFNRKIYYDMFIRFVITKLQIKIPKRFNL